jgi:2-keto-4-pentenoate hydratase/2-oxohepta-3-ene-1,7-dioic acid hydratase in catechol pathway
MQLCMYTSRANRQLVPGLATLDGLVYDLCESLQSIGADATVPADLLGVIQSWPRIGPAVMAAVSELERGDAVATVVDAHLHIPFPAPRRDAFAIGGNYRQHVEAASRTTGVALTDRKSPVFFMKPTGAFSGPYDDIVYDPSFTERVDYEVELGVVIGKGGRDISRDEAMDHVFGYMVVNDVSARDIMLRNKPQVDHFRGKGLDTFFPMGPGVTLRDAIADYRDLRLLLRVNGELRQDAYAGDMTRDIPEIIAELSTSLSLYPGDIIATGTPAGVAQEAEAPVFLKDGDLVETEIDGLGRLSNQVRTRNG